MTQAHLVLGQNGVNATRNVAVVLLSGGEPAPVPYPTATVRTVASVELRLKRSLVILKCVLLMVDIHLGRNGPRVPGCVVPVSRLVIELVLNQLHRRLAKIAQLLDKPSSKKLALSKIVKLLVTGQRGVIGVNVQCLVVVDFNLVPESVLDKHLVKATLLKDNYAMPTTAQFTATILNGNLGVNVRRNVVMANQPELVNAQVLPQPLAGKRALNNNWDLVMTHKNATLEIAKYHVMVDTGHGLDGPSARRAVVLE